MWICVSVGRVQIELDKTAEDFRKAHSERQELIMQWENTIEQMQRRDREMDLLAAVSCSPLGCRLFRYLDVYVGKKSQENGLHAEFVCVCVCVWEWEGCVCVWREDVGGECVCEG